MSVGTVLLLLIAWRVVNDLASVGLVGRSWEITPSVAVFQVITGALHVWAYLWLASS